MITRLAVMVLVAVMLNGCATSRRAPLQVSRNVAVLPTNNLTGDPLLVMGAGLIDRYVRHTGEVSVGDVLQSEARYQLQLKGFDVALWQTTGAAPAQAPKSLDAALEMARRSGTKNSVLYLEIRRWEADAPTQTRFVIVGLSASLFDPVSGRELWHENRAPAPVGTQGTITVEAAYVAAARKVIAEMLAPLKPEPPAK